MRWVVAGRLRRRSEPDERSSVRGSCHLIPERALRVRGIGLMVGKWVVVMIEGV
jgi:hypothetical protein